MIIPDVNLLLYANIAAFPQPAAARRWFETAVNGEQEVGLAEPALFGFIRIATNPRVFDPAMSADDAVARVEAWLARPHVHFLSPGPRHLEIAFELLRRLGTGRKPHDGRAARSPRA